MIKNALGLIIFGCVFSSSVADKLPSYITQCSVSDPNINECIVNSGNAAMPTIIKGDKKYRIPKFNPFHIDQLDIDPSQEFHLGLKNISIFGLKDTVLLKSRTDLKIRKINITVSIPHIEILGTYETNGRILILPIKGQGFCNITITGGIYSYETDLVTSKIEDGEEYLKCVESKADFLPEQVYLNFHNLVTEQLGGEINMFLNENWMILASDFKPTIISAITSIADSILGGVLTKIPYNNLFKQ